MGRAVKHKDIIREGSGVRLSPCMAQASMLRKDHGSGALLTPAENSQ